jgi:hypothetical protein
LNAITNGRITHSFDILILFENLAKAELTASAVILPDEEYSLPPYDPFSGVAIRMELPISILFVGVDKLT